MHNPRQIFAERLKLLRQARKLNQGELAKKIGIERSSISSYENATRFPTIEILISIANFFSVSLDYLIGIQNKIPLHYVSALKMTSSEAKKLKESFAKIKGLIDSAISEKDT